MNTDIVILREVITKLVPMLTNKGLIVTQRGSKAFVDADPVTRKPKRVNIPHIPDDASPDFVNAVQGFIDHECGHVIVTDWDWIGGYKLKPAEIGRTETQRLISVQNMVEDVMIEREMMARFPGSRKNIAVMRDYFIKKITTPAVNNAKDDREKIRYLLVVLIRALGGHREFQEYMDQGNHWDMPMVKAFVNALSPEVKTGLLKCKTTKETFALAKEIDAILYPKIDPPKIISITPNQGSSVGGSVVEIIGENFIDLKNISVVNGQDAEIIAHNSSKKVTVRMPAHPAGPADIGVATNHGSAVARSMFEFVDPQQQPSEGGGSGESDDKSEEKSDNDSEESENKSDSDDKSGDKSDDSEKKPDDEEKEADGESQEDGEDADGDDESDASGDEDQEDGDGEQSEDEGSSDQEEGSDESDTSDDADGDKDGEGGEQENESEVDSESSEDDENDGDSENSGSGEKPDDAGGDDDGSEDAQDGSDGDGDTEQDGDSQEEGDASQSSNGSDTEEEDDGSGSSAEGSDTKVAVQTDDHEAGELGEGEEGTSGEGIGNGLGKSMFELDDDHFKEADVSSQIAIIIQNEAVDALGESDYNVFSREFDRIEPLKIKGGIPSEWVPKLEEDTRQMVGKMQKDIERMMASQSHVIKVPGYRSGKLHSANLHRILNKDDRIFNRRQEHKSKDTAVTLLIDNSGSMGQGGKIKTAMIAGYALMTTLEKVSIPCEVLGFTTGDISGEGSVKFKSEMNDEIRNAHARGFRYHRVSPIIMPIYKSFDERNNSVVKERIAWMANAQQGMVANVDGESLEYAAIRLMKRREKRKVILVLSDGQPSGGQNVGPHLKKVVKDLENVGIDLVGIGIRDNSVSRFYKNHVYLGNIEDLPSQVMDELKKILAK